MKNFIRSIAFVLICLVSFSSTGHSQSSFANYLGVKDTLIDADTTQYVVSIPGNKTISLQCNVIKISGTVAGKLDIYGSVDGTTYETALAVTSVTKTDATANYVVKIPINYYKKLKILSISSGTNHHSQRIWMRYL